MILLVLGSIGRAVTIAGIDLISTANGKAAGAALFERKDIAPAETFVKTLHDEALEPFWATTISSLLAEISSTVTPWLPEQVAIIPGKMLGETWHWLITSRQSTHGEKFKSNNEEGKEKDIFSVFFDTFVKKPSDLLLRICGLKEKEGNFLWYSISQLGSFGLLSYFLRNDDEENLPGVNIDRNEGALKSIAKGIGYTLVEQVTYAISQTIRFSIDFKKEFQKTGGNILAKSLANVINERFYPGHILLGISSAVSTYSLGRYIPKTTAAAIGEFPMAILNRILNCRNRRATKHQFEYVTYIENGKEIKVPIAYKFKNNEKVKNYRYNDSSIFNGFLDTCDSVLYNTKDKTLDLVTYAFCKTENKEEFKAELIKSFDVSEEVLKENQKKVNGKLIRVR